MKKKIDALVEYIEKFASQEYRKYGIERSRYIEWLLYLNNVAAQRVIGNDNLDEVEYYNAHTTTKLLAELDEHFKENGIKHHPGVFAGERWKGYFEDGILIANGDVVAQPNALRNLFSTEMQLNSIPLISPIRIINLEFLDNYNSSMKRFNEGLNLIYPIIDELGITQDQQNLNMRSDVSNKVEEKYNDARFGSEYPELFEYVLFSEFVDRNHKGKVMTQGNVDDLASLYEEEMDFQIKKIKMSIVIYQSLRILSIVLFFSVLFSNQEPPLIFLSIGLMALFNFVGPDKVRDMLR